MNSNRPISRVSVHGGHSREFCCHAEDTLEEIVCAYIEKGFAWFGITEHMPPPEDRFLYPDEISAGFDAGMLYDRFARYMADARRLQRKYASSARIFVAFETETYTGSLAFADTLRNTFRPDYVLGSVHHVNDTPIDATEDQYRESADISGGIDALYCDYFDQQYDMIRFLKPEVIGHFDLIRIFDQEYRRRLEKPEIRQRIDRNLALIKEYDLILDFNVRALAKGMAEPFVSTPILQKARTMGISVVPGDDSHGVRGVGLNLDRGITLLQEMGFDTRWALPMPE
jgi:histidinol-phosphatase (PHP family)